MLKVKPLTFRWGARRRAPTGRPPADTVEAGGASETVPQGQSPATEAVKLDASEGDPGENADLPTKDGAAKADEKGASAPETPVTASVAAGESAAAAASNVGVAVVGPNGAAATSLVGAVCVGPGGGAATSNSANSCNVAIQSDSSRASRT